MGEVGTTKVYENEKIIVWEFTLEPGEETPLHEHKNDYIFYIQNGSKLQVFGEKGNDLGTLDATTGSVFAFKVENGYLVSTDEKNLRVPVTHTAKNVGTSNYKEILVETKNLI
tara:strand:+ start:1245 stop:1583 length:339 start_codon:yes stop_codon:yes gene_type:complete